MTVLALASCKDETFIPSPDDAVLASISVWTDTPGVREASRSVITETTLPDASRIGTSIRQSSDGTVYKGYANTLWTASGTGSSQTWSTTDEVMLGVTKCTCYGYYPYNPEVTDITNVPIEVASQTDYMYAHPYPDFWMGYPEAELTMKHALAVMRVIIKAGSTFSGAGNIQAFNMTGEFPATATMNALTGELSNFQGKAAAIGLSGVTLTTNGVTIEQIIIPDGQTKTFNMGIRVDGKTYGLNSSYTHTIEAGNIYTYTITINGTSASLTNVDIEPWTASSMQAQSAQVAPSVTVSGDTQNIAVSTSKDGDGNVILTAVPTSDDLSVNEVSLTTDGSATLDQSLDASTGIRTVTLASVNSPCVINFTGTTISGYNLQAVYNVSGSRSESTNLLSSSTGFDLSKVTRMVVDGTLVDPTTSVELSVGNHTVKYRLMNNELPPHMFDGVTSLTQLDLGSDISSVGDYAFNGCTSLASLSFPASVSAVGDHSIAGCSAITELHIPATLTAVGTGGFQGCTGLSSVNMENMVLSDAMFSGCTSLASFIVPEGVTTIPDNCFAGCTALTEVTLPSTLASVAGGAFSDCASLATITTQSMTAPTVDATSFVGVAVDGTLYVKPDATGYDAWLATGSGLESWTQTISSYYVVELNNQWQASSVENPDAELYDGVYESFSNYNVNSTAAAMTIKVKGYETFTIYIRSYAESGCDYVMASQLDQSINNSTSYSNTTLVKGHTRSKQTSATAISNYTELVYTLPDKKTEYTITVVYRKDGSGNSGTDKGYLLIKKQ